MNILNLHRLSVGILLLLALLLGDQYFEAQAEFPARDKEIVLSVEGLGCITCEWAIEGNLKDLAGVKEADVTSKRITWWNPFSAKEGKAFITYDADSVTIERLIETIEKSSDAVYTYTASVLSESQIGAEVRMDDGGLP